MENPSLDEAKIAEISRESKDCLGWILDGMGIAAEIEAHFRDGHLLLDVQCGEDSSIAIGRKGQTLEALQTLVSRIIAGSFQEVAQNSLKLLVDVEGYRERRRLNLIDMAKRMAEEVLETGNSAAVVPLNGYERYIIHSALHDESGIQTSSTGSGPMKEIVISLRD